jgi:hypothetical protein
MNRSLVESVCESLGDCLNLWSTNLKNVDEEQINAFYDPDSKLTLLQKNVLGEIKKEGADIAKFLQGKNSEFASNSFSYLVTADNLIVVTGVGVWANSSSWFTFVFKMSPLDGHRVSIVNQIISPLG